MYLQYALFLRRFVPFGDCNVIYYGSFYRLQAINCLAAIDTWRPPLLAQNTTAEGGQASFGRNAKTEKALGVYRLEQIGPTALLPALMRILVVGIPSDQRQG